MKKYWRILSPSGCIKRVLKGSKWIINNHSDFDWSNLWQICGTIYLDNNKSVCVKPLHWPRTNYCSSQERPAEWCMWFKTCKPCGIGENNQICSHNIKVWIYLLMMNKCNFHLLRCLHCMAASASLFRHFSFLMMAVNDHGFALFVIIALTTCLRPTKARN